ncbi:MAG: glycosyltransferase family 9 protein [Calditrichaeota bacterium]|nr:glycosyltransferase family 9 protein [Calditrichota bacterium]
MDPVGKELLANLPYFDRLIVYDRKGRDRGAFGYLRTLRQIRSFAPDTAILLKRFFRNGLLARLGGAQQRVGFETNQKAPLLNLTIPYDESVHVTELDLRLVRKIGAAADVPFLPEIKVLECERKEAECILAESGVQSEFTVAHFGGYTSGADFVSTECRRDLLRTLVRNKDVVIIGSGESEGSRAQKLANELDNAVALTDIPLRLTMAVISMATAFIGTNSGPMHIASAAQVPGIALFRRDDRYEIEKVKWRPKYEGIRVVPVIMNEPACDTVMRSQAAWLPEL